MESGMELFVPEMGEANFTITGDKAQILTFSMPPGSDVHSEAGTLIFRHDGVLNSIACEGCFQRCIGGEACCGVVYHNSKGENAVLGLAPNFPASVIPINLSAIGGVVRTQKGAYMAHTGEDVQVEVSCDFDCCRVCCAGQGCIRQKVSGSGWVFLNAGGTIVQKQLAAGEVLVCDNDAILAWGGEAELGFATAGNCCAMCCGGEGIFNPTITGPGLAVVQSMSFAKYRNAMIPVIPARANKPAEAPGAENA